MTRLSEDHDTQALEPTDWLPDGTWPITFTKRKHHMNYYGHLERALRPKRECNCWIVHHELSNYCLYWALRIGLVVKHIKILHLKCRAQNVDPSDNRQMVYVHVTDTA